MNLKEVFLNLTPAEFKIWTYLQIYFRENAFEISDIVSHLEMSFSSIDKALRTMKLLKLVKLVEKRNEGHRTKNIFALNGVFYDVFSPGFTQKHKSISRPVYNEKVDPKGIIDELIKTV